LKKVIGKYSYPADFTKMANDQRNATFIRHKLAGIFQRIFEMLLLRGFTQLRLKQLEQEKKN